MRKKMGAVCFVLTCVFVLSGCLYPQSKKVEKSVPAEEQVLAVQKAVDQFREEQSGLLPIKNQDATVPYYQKYPIDFNRLEKYLPEPPGNAYESGGVFQYVLIDVEDNPTVKLFDLRMASVLQEHNLRLFTIKKTSFLRLRNNWIHMYLHWIMRNWAMRKCLS